MNRKELLQFHKKITARAFELMQRKNHDYAGKRGDDPFANFRRCAWMGVCSTEHGFLVRLTDKLSRLSTFVEAGKLQVAGESVADTCEDLINYAVLFAAFVQSTKQTSNATRRRSRSKSRRFKH